MSTRYSIYTILSRKFKILQIDMKEYQVGQDDVMIGEIGGIPFYISDTQHEAWKNTDLIIDCVKGMGGMFSLDNGTGRRFLTRSEICIPEKTTLN